MLSHINANNQPTMVDISSKQTTTREATARAVVSLPDHFTIFASGSDLQTAKGPVFATAIIAGTFAAKKTSELIPFCHSLNIDSCKFDIQTISPCQIEVRCTVKTFGPTGVEMEAIIGVSLAAATIYDMCKSLTHHITIGPIELIAKSGGKRDFASSH